MAPLVWLLGAAAAYGGYKLGIESPPRFLGDLAKVGDNVQEDVTNFLQQNSLPANTPLVATASLGGFVFMKVEKTTKDDLFGPLIVTSGGATPRELRPSDFSIPSGAFRMSRAGVTMINRGGKTATKFTVPGLAERLTKSPTSQGATFAGTYPFDREYRPDSFGAAQNTRAFKG